MAQRGRPRKEKPTIVIKRQGHGLTKDQVKALRKIEENLGDIRRMLFGFDELETITKMAFCAGQLFDLVNKTEDDTVDVLEDILGYDEKYSWNELG